MKKTTTKEKQKMAIQDLHAIVHRGQDRGISALSTLAKYGITNRAYYTQCKRNGLPSWRELNKENILVKKGVKLQKRGLCGGSLQESENDFDDFKKRVTFAT